MGGSSSEFSAIETGYNKSVYVQAKPMDELLIHDLNLKRVDWIKIDVEKAEYEVLQGLEKTLSKFKPRLFIEVWSKNVHKVKALLRSYGYSLIIVSNTLGSGSERCRYTVGVPTEK